MLRHPEDREVADVPGLREVTIWGGGNLARWLLMGKSCQRCRYSLSEESVVMDVEEKKVLLK